MTLANSGEAPFAEAGTGRNRVISIWLAGTGLVGGSLLSQLADRAEAFRARFGLELRVAGIANSRRMSAGPGFIDPARWQASIEEGGEPADLGAFVARALGACPAGTVFVDCTASEAPVRHYAELLGAGIALIAANKRAGSGPLPELRSILEASRSSGAPFLYETTVGAALPVISTLRDILISGDRITRIDAALSGTMGFVLGGWHAGEGSFSSLVRRARELGYTEPDPREDLSALDLARKALILARETGLALEAADVAIEPIVPRASTCAGAGAGSVTEFLDRLEEAEADMRPRLEAARSRGTGLAYAATVAGGRASVGWREVLPGDALHGLRGGESAVAFTTERYATLPLVVRGRGAGAGVTAGGVLADIVRGAGMDRPWVFPYF